MVSVEKYPCFCGAGLRRFESKDGRGFLKCKDEMCTLFTPEEKYINLMECYELKFDKMFKPNNFPLCRCEDVSSLWVSNSVSNPGRPYFRCEETDTDDKCDFFQWADGKTKVKKGMKKKKRDLKRLQKRTSGVEKPKKVMKRIYKTTSII